MRSRFVVLAAVVLAAVAGNTLANDTTFVVVGYIPDYRLPRWSKQLGPVTDLILFGMSMPVDGRFDSAALSKQHVQTVNEIKRSTGCRLLFTVGGWKKSDGFDVVVSDSETRDRFIRDACGFCVRNGFDGMDLDWEHPEGETQIAGFARLLRETRIEFRRQQLMVTIAQAGWQDLGADVYREVDRVHLMSYDHSFPQATLEKSQDDVERLINAGCESEKIVLGLPCYGRNREQVARTYAQLMNNRQLSSEASVVDGFAFNGPAMITKKVRYARQEKLAGVMIWELGQDITGPQSLLTAVAEGLSP